MDQPSVMLPVCIHALVEVRADARIAPTEAALHSALSKYLASQLTERFTMDGWRFAKTTVSVIA